MSFKCLCLNSQKMGSCWLWECAVKCILSAVLHTGHESAWRQRKLNLRPDRMVGKTVIHSVMLEWTTDCIAVQHYDASKVSILACLLLFHTNHHDNPLTLAARSQAPPFPHSHIPPISLSIYLSSSVATFFLAQLLHVPYVFPSSWMADVTLQSRLSNTVKK